MHGTAFAWGFGIMLSWEGGVSDHIDDSGGYTVRGVTLRLLRALRLDPNNDGVIDKRDLLGLSEPEIADIYRENFWDLCLCGDMPDGIALAVFDSAVNQGPGAAVRMLQKAAKVTVDGMIGPVTLSAVRRVSSRPRVLDHFMARRALRYCRHPKVLVFGLGWFRRLMGVHRAAIEAPKR